MTTLDLRIQPAGEVELHNVRRRRRWSVELEPFEIGVVPVTKAKCRALSGPGSVTVSQSDSIVERGAHAACNIGIGDYSAQAAKAMENMLLALDAAGASLQDVIFTRVLVATTERTDLVEAWNVIRSAFGDHDVPSTLLGVTVLGYENQLVEIEATAAVLD